MIDVLVDSRVRVPEEDLSSDVVDALREKFTRKNPMYWKLRKLGRRVWGVEPEVKCWRREGDFLTFGRGALPLVREILSGSGVVFRVRDRRTPGGKAAKLTHFVEERDYQEDQIRIGIEKENCILRASTGAGKTTIGLGLAAAVETNVIVLVDSGGIAEEWVRRCRKELEIEPGYLGGGTKKLGRVTIALHQTVNAMKPDAFQALIDYFGAVIVDEVQVLGAKTYGRNVDRMSARYRWGLSDDHHRADGRTFLVTDLMGAVADKIGDRDLLERGAIAPVEVFVDPLDFEASWYVNRPLDVSGDPVPPSGEEFTRLLEEMTGDDRRTSKIAARVADEVEKGETFLVASHRVEHVKKILRMLEGAGVPAGPMLGGTAEFETTRAGLLSGLLKVGVGTLKALGKGVNVPDVTAGYAATPVATSTQTWRQWKGRIIRPKADGGTAKVWVSWDRFVFGDAPVRKLVKWHRGHVQIAVGSELLTPAEYAGTRKRKGKGTNDGRKEDADDAEREHASG